MSSTRIVTIVGAAILLNGCATAPVPVSALPGPNKDPISFQRDDAACRIAAARAAYPSGAIPAPPIGAPYPGNPNVNWQAFFAAYGKCEAARGNLVQPIPWAIAYQLYLGFGAPYPFYPPA